MSRLQTSFVLFLTLCVFNFLMVGPAFSQQNWYAKADITKNRPVVKSQPEEKIPVEKIPGKEKSGGGKWLWAILGIALVGGIAAAVGGGGGGGGGDGDDTPPAATTGSVAVSW